MVLVDRWNGSHGAAVSEIGVVLAPSEVLAGFLKLKVWKSGPLVTLPLVAEVMVYAPSEDVLRSELAEPGWETVEMVELRLLSPEGWQFEQWHCWSDRRMLNREDLTVAFEE
jgi:hypothetical protein